MSGGLPPRTAVVTFCRVLSLLTYSVLTLSPGLAFSYWLTSFAKVLGSVPVQPSQTWIEALLLVPPPPPPPPPPLWLSVPQADSATAPTASRLAMVTYSRCLAIPFHFLLRPREGLLAPARSVQVFSNSDHASTGCQGVSKGF